MTARVTLRGIVVHAVEVEGAADLGGDAAHAVEQDAAGVRDDLGVALDGLDRRLDADVGAASRERAPSVSALRSASSMASASTPPPEARAKVQAVPRATARLVRPPMAR